MWSTAGCLAAMFLVLAFMVATLALRSLWKFRHEPPWTPLRIVLLTLLIIGGSILAVVLRSDALLVPIISVVVLGSVSWLIARGL
jgi:hypothetical protein